jgi:large subunit ribosomal protein L31
MLMKFPLRNKKIAHNIFYYREKGLSLQSEIKYIKEYNQNKNYKMKKGIHPENYRPVVFKDMSNEEIFISRSTVNARETIEIDGVTYPLVKLEITSSSHPFYTGKQKLVDTAGRVDKFMSRYAKRAQAKKG